MIYEVTIQEVNLIVFRVQADTVEQAEKLSVENYLSDPDAYYDADGNYKIVDCRPVTEEDA